MIVACVQICSSFKKEENYRKIGRFVEEAAKRGVKFVVLPEHWNWLGKNEDKRANAEALNGPSIQYIQRLAKQYQCTIVAGSIAESNGEQPPFNTSVTIHPDGSLGKVYRKIHLFDTEVAGGHKESAHTSAGHEVVVESIPSPSPQPSPIRRKVGEGLKVGIAICYDVRFPELFRAMAAKGADIFAIPSNFTAVTGPPHWEVLVRARAIENQCFVVAADQTGLTGTGWEAHGHSMVVDPWGEVLAKAGREEGIITAELKLEKISEIRTQMPVMIHRRVK